MNDISKDLTVGASLREIRVALGVSIADVARHLRGVASSSANWVIAMERDKKLPVEIIYYVRALAATLVAHQPYEIDELKTQVSCLDAQDFDELFDTMLQERKKRDAKPNTG